MRALVVDHSAPGHLSLTEIPDPQPKEDEALVEVRAISLNFGEIQFLLPAAKDGAVLGWDAAGVVIRAAANGTGPAVGEHVITLANDGAWAERRAVPTNLLGVVRKGADLGAISTIPVAAASALRALRRLGPVLGRRVLIVGATGGVGRFAVQLAAMSGAYVIATASDPAHVDGLRALGAHEVRILPKGREPREALGPIDPVFGVLDMIGGPYLVAAYAALQGGGTLVSIGHTSGAPEVFEFGAFFGTDGRHDRAIVTFYLLDDVRGMSEDLAWLAEQVANGKLDPQIQWRGGWERVTEGAELLLGRRLQGKAVLDVS